jgi:hypothetical protein
MLDIDQPPQLATTSLNRRAIISIAAIGCFMTNYADIKRKTVTT